MNRVAAVFGIVIGLLSSGVSAAESAGGQSKEIPLDSIWAYKMPGTRDIRELEPRADTNAVLEQAKQKPITDRDKWLRNELISRSDVEKILHCLGQRPADRAKAGPVFVVRGVGKEALANAVSGFTSIGEPDSDFSPDVDLSLVFFTHSSGRYVRLDSVERWSNVITIRYQFVDHITAEVTRHFALIPLGKLKSGTYRVQVEQVKSADDTAPGKNEIDPQSLVSGSTSFVVQKE